MLLGKVAEEASGKATDGLFERLFSPAAFFWAAGGLAWLTASPEHRFGWAFAQLEQLSDARLLGLLVGVLALIVLSSAAYDPIADYVLGALAGTWRWFAFAGAPFTALLWKQHDRRLRRWQTLALRDDKRTEPEDREFDGLDRALKYTPSARSAMVPTSFGCALVASDRRIAAKYGLLSQTVWPALSLVLSDGARKVISDAYAPLLDSARLVFFSVLALVWSPLNPYIIPVALVFALVAYARLDEQGRDYADAIEAAFDTGRFALYRALAYPSPPNARVEPAYGAQISKYLRRGLDDEPPVPFSFKPDG